MFQHHARSENTSYPWFSSIAKGHTFPLMAGVSWSAAAVSPTDSRAEFHRSVSVNETHLYQEAAADAV